VSGQAAASQVSRQVSEQAAAGQVNGQVVAGWVSGLDRFGSGGKGFPLQSPPFLEKHRPDACVIEEMGQKGIKSKATVWMQHGAAGFWI
jgi:hypothetical protein